MCVPMKLQTLVLEMLMEVAATKAKAASLAKTGLEPDRQVDDGENLATNVLPSPTRNWSKGDNQLHVRNADESATTDEIELNLSGH